MSPKNTVTAVPKPARETSRAAISTGSSEGRLAGRHRQDGSFCPVAGIGTVVVSIVHSLGSWRIPVTAERTEALYYESEVVRHVQSGSSVSSGDLGRDTVVSTQGRESDRTGGTRVGNDGLVPGRNDKVWTWLSHLRLSESILLVRCATPFYAFDAYRLGGAGVPARDCMLPAGVSPHASERSEAGVRSYGTRLFGYAHSSIWGRVETLAPDSGKNRRTACRREIRRRCGAADCPLSRVALATPLDRLGLVRQTCRTGAHVRRTNLDAVSIPRAYLLTGMNAICTDRVDGLLHGQVSCAAVHP